MIITNIAISNYRGISQPQTIPLNRFSSFVGKNDAGKSIILNAIATFLNPKDNPITSADFNNADEKIEIACTFLSEELRDTLEKKVKSKVKKSDGLDEFIDDVLFDGQLTVRKSVTTSKKVLIMNKYRFLTMKTQTFSFYMENLTMI